MKSIYKILILNSRDLEMLLKYYAQRAILHICSLLLPSQSLSSFQSLSFSSHSSLPSSLFLPSLTPSIPHSWISVWSTEIFMPSFSPLPFFFSLSLLSALSFVTLPIYQYYYWITHTIIISIIIYALFLLLLSLWL